MSINHFVPRQAFVVPIKQCEIYNLPIKPVLLGRESFSGATHSTFF